MHIRSARRLRPFGAEEGRVGDARAGAAPLALADDTDVDTSTIAGRRDAAGTAGGDCRRPVSMADGDEPRGYTAPGVAGVEQEQRPGGDAPAGRKPVQRRQTVDDEGHARIVMRLRSGGERLSFNNEMLDTETEG